jgi:arylsulfatase A-like enzyme
MNSTACSPTFPSSIQWKGHVPGGKDYHFPIIQLDMVTTCLAAAGSKADPAQKLDGVNLLPYLNGANAGAPHDALYWRFGRQWAIRKGDWKLVVSTIDGPEPRLFNLADDIGKSKDLLAKNPANAKELKAQWDAWNAEQAKPLWVPRNYTETAKKDKKDVKQSRLGGFPLQELIPGAAWVRWEEMVATRLNPWNGRRRFEIVEND